MRVRRGRSRIEAGNLRGLNGHRLLESGAGGLPGVGSEAGWVELSRAGPGIVSFA